jgi:hypothetical protein
MKEAEAIPAGAGGMMRNRAERSVSPAVVIEALI